MKIAVILNYINFKQTIACCNKLLEAGLDEVVIVDNFSPNNSMNEIKSVFSENNKVLLVQNSVNNGYARGNNYALRIIEHEVGVSDSNIIFIVNPDVSVNKDAINKISDCILRIPNVGAMTSLINGSTSGVWHHLTPSKAFLFNSWTCRWLLLKLKIREGGKYKKGKTNLTKVDVVTGAFFGIKQTTFKDVNYFDEGTFMYYEEESLHKKLEKSGKQNYLLNTVNTLHQGRGSTSLSKIKFKQINDKSRLYFLKKYYKVNSTYIFFTKCVNKFENWLLKIAKR
ncbi:glycosyltransferase family 2 protein [Pediococcus ethanolidurans]|uniref:glycosyltransferase n=1 Tax=Pediococcus ethanolidurans TaxID=319653 RepID=UPI0021AA4FC7|nr:glycosyltransferase [Pediococcus ethanolidurans]MCT4397414.1 glycosyltransferase family 2 protein [Pediococcus ethanolidurans]